MRVKMVKKSKQEEVFNALTQFKVTNEKVLKQQTVIWSNEQSRF
jgi:hypothetical protein